MNRIKKETFVIDASLFKNGTLCKIPSAKKKSVKTPGYCSNVPELNESMTKFIANAFSYRFLSISSIRCCNPSSVMIGWEMYIRQQAALHLPNTLSNQKVSDIILIRLCFIILADEVYEANHSLYFLWKLNAEADMIKRTQWRRMARSEFVWFGEVSHSAEALCFAYRQLWETLLHMLLKDAATAEGGW